LIRSSRRTACGRTSLNNGVQPLSADRNVRIFPMDASAIPVERRGYVRSVFLDLERPHNSTEPEGPAIMRYFLSLHDVNGGARRTPPCR
jgi:hypothetical protein